MVAGLILGASAVRLSATPLAVSTARRGASSEALAFSTVFDAHLRLRGRVQSHYGALKGTPFKWLDLVGCDPGLWHNHAAASSAESGAKEPLIRF